jgi:ribosome modulation factor
MPESPDLDRAFEDGRSACRRGLAKADNPYGVHDPRATAWLRGWLGQHEAMMMDLRGRSDA